MVTGVTVRNACSFHSRNDLLIWLNRGYRKSYMYPWMDSPTMQRTTILGLTSLIILVIGCLGLIYIQLCMAQPNLTEFPMNVVDGFGRNVTIERVPERIISLSPGNTETLFALGAGSKVIGVTRYCDYPSEVVARVQGGSLNVVGGSTDPNIEIIVSLQPDLILTSLDLQ